MARAHIRPLSSEVIGQIAAGEVVERPAAAIKELVENSMDAGATAITVDIRDGGLTSFRVVDNGDGIQPSDIRLAFERHATSKIVTAADLYGVQTLGFRGEALASIAAVSKMSCVTRTRNAEFGLSVQNEGGVLGEIKEAACAEGTAFTVKDLFYNAPVRRKFMKKPSVETAYISDLMMRLILSHPEISFRYIADGKTIYFSAGDGKLESTVMSIYGLDTLGKLKHVSGHMNGLVLDGFVGIGEAARGNRSHQTFVLNGRLIKSNLLTASMEESCRQRVMIGRFPLCVLHLTLPFEQADVNVHPNKWEVRFQNELQIREAISTLVAEALQEKAPLQTAPKLFDEKIERISAVHINNTPVAASRPAEKLENIKKQNEISIKETEDFNKNTKVYNYQNEILNNADRIRNVNTYLSENTGKLTAHSAPMIPLNVSQKQLSDGIVPSSVPDLEYVAVPERNVPSAADISVKKLQAAEIPATLIKDSSPEGSANAEPKEEKIEQLSETTVEAAFSKQNVRMIGVVFNTYIILECDDRMLLCDQHAVHERLLFERMLKACEGDAASQMLLAPELVKLTHREYEIFQENREALHTAGFDADDFGDMTVQLRAVPMVLGASRSPDCFRDALDDLADGRSISTQKRTERIIQMACKHAVKGGERLPREELFDLVRRMISENVTPTCPHGRPLIVEVTHRELDKRFRRIQN